MREDCGVNVISGDGDNNDNCNRGAVNDAEDGVNNAMPAGDSAMREASDHANANDSGRGGVDDDAQTVGRLSVLAYISTNLPPAITMSYAGSVQQREEEAAGRGAADDEINEFDNDSNDNDKNRNDSNDRDDDSFAGRESKRRKMAGGADSRAGDANANPIIMQHNNNNTTTNADPMITQ